MITDTAPINYTTCCALPFDSVVHSDFLNNTLPDKCANLIIADPPYFEVKGAFDFVWNSFEDYLKDVEKWAIECKRILADNGTIIWYGDAKRIAYTQVIFDKYFNLLNSLVWENTNDHKQQIRFNTDLRTFAPLTERLLMYQTKYDDFGAEAAFEQFMKPNNPFANYLKEEFKRANVSNREIAKLFPSKTGGLTGCVSNWLNGDNVITEEQWNKVKDFLGSKYLQKPYSELTVELKKVKQEFESKRRPFNNERFYGDVIRLPNYETGNFDHDTIKPEKLTRILINTCSRKNDLVVVPFAGSGTEVAMSIKEGRKAIGYDIEKKYVDMSNARIKTFKDAPTLF